MATTATIDFSIIGISGIVWTVSIVRKRARSNIKSLIFVMGVNMHSYAENARLFIVYVRNVVNRQVCLFDTRMLIGRFIL